MLEWLTLENVHNYQINRLREKIYLILLVTAEEVFDKIKYLFIFKVLSKLDKERNILINLTKGFSGNRPGITTSVKYFIGGLIIVQ